MISKNGGPAGAAGTGEEGGGPYPERVEQPSLLERHGSVGDRVRRAAECRGHGEEHVAEEQLDERLGRRHHHAGEDEEELADHDDRPPPPPPVLPNRGVRQRSPYGSEEGAYVL